MNKLTCPWAACGKQFSRKDKLNEHIRKRHAEEHFNTTDPVPHDNNQNVGLGPSVNPAFNNNPGFGGRLAYSNSLDMNDGVGMSDGFEYNNSFSLDGGLVLVNAFDANSGFGLNDNFASNAFGLNYTFASNGSGSNNNFALNDAGLNTSDFENSFGPDNVLDFDQYIDYDGMGLVNSDFDLASM